MTDVEARQFHQTAIRGAIVAGVLGSILIWWPLPWAGSIQAGETGSGLSSAAGGLGAIAYLTLTILIIGAASVIWAITIAAPTGPLAGVLVMACGMTAAAFRCGDLTGWLQQAESPRGYVGLAFESLFMLACLAAAFVAIDVGRHLLRARLGLLPDPILRRPLVWLNRDSLLAMLICATLGGIGVHFLGQTAERGQAIAAVLISFIVVGFLGQITLRNACAAAILLSPLVAAIVAYLYVGYRFDTQSSLHAAWHGGSLTGLAMAMPIHYAAAGVLGAATGVAWAQAQMGDDDYAIDHNQLPRWLTVHVRASKAASGDHSAFASPISRQDATPRDTSDGAGSDPEADADADDAVEVKPPLPDPPHSARPR